MSADGAAVVSGVDLALVSWMDGPALDLSAAVSTTTQRRQQRVGRCLCAGEAAAPAASDGPPAPALKPAIKQRHEHVVPQVVHVAKHEQSDSLPGGSSSNNGGPPIKPILSRKNWSGASEAGGGPQSIQRHDASCLRRYDSQQSCKSAVTLRSYISTQSRGECRPR